ncbi:MAG: GH92 family glycosyl hydrolase [Bacteroidales bacterium]
MIKIILYAATLILFLFAFGSCQTKIKDAEPLDYTQFVNPLIGTGEMGHVYPGATAPFGMVQLSPQTHFEPMHDSEGNYNKDVYKYCSGYQYADTTIIGFAHTNFSGTGHSDLGDVLIMPTTKKIKISDFKSPTDFNAFASKYSHDSEFASPGYYEVFLENDSILAQMTATDRVGYHKYTFKDSNTASIVLDMVYNIYHHEDKNVWTFIRVENDTLITGYRQTQGWARTRTVYFSIQTSKPIVNYGHKKFDKTQYQGFYRRFDQENNFPEFAGKNIKAFFEFDMQNDPILEIKVALSPVSTDGAKLNALTEAPNWNFDEIKSQTQKKWNNELSKIDAEFISDEDKLNFYTALYHTCLSPIIYQDVDKKYRGLDQNIHVAKDFDNYTIFSLWDTYRALHPLFNIIQPERNVDMIKSMLAHYQQSVHKMLPIWSHYANENWCMIGYHAVSVIADAIAKGNDNFDKQLALQAAISTANVPYFDGLGYYLEYNFVPDDKSHSSVSKTLEFAYNDWCISEIAKGLNNKDVQEEYLQRSNNFINVFDTVSGFMRPRLSDLTFRKNFDPSNTSGQGFIEGNAWNYGLYVPHNIDKMIEMMGGKQKFESYLDTVFTMYIEDEQFEHNEDITRHGIIGGYVHGNEPGHHIPYLYNWTDSQHKTQERVREILKTMYKPTFDGLCGNDDVGQMSAWYIFSALGFYPILPGSSYYLIGSPVVKNAFVKLGNGKVFKVEVENQSDENIYVKNVYINGKKISDYTLNHEDIHRGGTLKFEMTDKPN